MPLSLGMRWRTAKPNHTSKRLLEVEAFPREAIDVWRSDANAGEHSLTCKATLTMINWCLVIN